MRFLASVLLILLLLLQQATVQSASIKQFGLKWFFYSEEPNLVRRQGAGDSDVIVESTVLDVTVTESSGPVIIVKTSTTDPVTITKDEPVPTENPEPTDSLEPSSETKPGQSFSQSSGKPQSPTTQDQSTDGQKRASPTTRTTPPPPEPTCPEGRFQCADRFAGGCCPNGYACAIDSCIPPPTVTETRACHPSSFRCPESVGFGCCPDGFTCGATVCVPRSTAASSSPPNQVTEEVTITRPADPSTHLQIITKGSDEPINLKIPPTTPTPTATFGGSGPVPDPDEGNKAIPNVTIAGIAVGVSVAAIGIVGAVWFTYRRLKARSNTDPAFSPRDFDTFGRGRDRHGEDVAASTGRAYDPNAPPVRNTRGFLSSSFHSFNPPREYFPRQPPRPLPQQDTFDFGFHDQHQQPHYQQRVVTDEVRPVFGKEEEKYAAVPLDSPAPLETPQVELGDTSIDPRGAIEHLHEVEGDQPEQQRFQGRSRIWNTGLERFGIKRSGNEASSSDF